MILPLSDSPTAPPAIGVRGDGPANLGTADRNRHLATVVNADMDAAREAIGEETVSEALVEGRGMSTEEAVDYATRVLEGLWKGA